MLDLDRPSFVGRDALRRVRDQGATRETIGLVGAPGDHSLPWLTDFWPLQMADGSEAGVVRWAVYSFALERPIAIALVDTAAAGASEYVAQSPDGPISMTRHPFPFVEGTAP
jgi:aminomethyltransferase